MSKSPSAGPRWNDQNFAGGEPQEIEVLSDVVAHLSARVSANSDIKI
jgi:hypothetical protein